MVHILYNPDEYFLCAGGHADGGEAGHDPVCAAVSTLMYLIVSFAEQEQDSQCILERGYALVACQPSENRRKVTKELFEMVVYCFRSMEQTYPKNVSLHVL